MLKSAAVLHLLVLIYHISEAQKTPQSYLSQDYFEIRPVITNEGNESSSLLDPLYESNYQEEINVALAFWNKGEEKEALAVFDKLKSLTGNENEIDLIIANLYFENRSFTKTLRLTNQILNRDPLMLEAKYLRGITQIETRAYSKALATFEELAKIPDMKTLAYYGMALTELEKENLHSSYILLNQCIQLDSSFLEPYLARARIDVFKNQIEHAQTLLNAGLNKYPEWQEGLIFDAMLQFHQDKDTLQLKDEVEHLLQLDPNNFNYLSLLGLIQMELEDWNEAVMLFRDALSINVDQIRQSKYRFSSKLDWSESIQNVLNYYFNNYSMEPEARKLFDQGICFFMIGEVAQSLQLFDQALTIEMHAAIFLFKGSILKNMFRQELIAIDAISEAIELDPNHWLPFFYRGELYSNLRKDDQAFADFEKAVEFNPELSRAFKHMGFIQMNKAKYDEAFLTFTKAMKIDTIDFDLFFNRAYCANKIERFQMASDDLSLLTSLKQDREAYYLLYNAKLGLRDTLSALVSLDSASRLSPKLTQYHQQLLDLAQAYDHKDFQMRAVKRLIKDDPYNSSLYFERGKLHLQDNDLYLAVDDLKVCLKGNKKNREGFFLLGMALVKLGKEKEGQKYLAKAKKMGYKP